MDGLVAAIDRSAAGPAEFEIINLGSGRAVALSRVVELLGSALEARPVVQRRPEHTGDVARTWADLTKAHALLGYTPRVALEEGIERFVRWFRETLD